MKSKCRVHKLFQEIKFILQLSVESAGTRVPQIPPTITFKFPCHLRYFLHVNSGVNIIGKCIVVNVHCSYKGQDGCLAVLDLLTAAMKPEQLDGENQYSCPR